MHAWGQKAFQERNKWTTRMGVDCVRKNCQISSVTQSYPRLCDPMDCSMPSFLVHHQLQELAQIHAHWVKNGIQLNKYSIMIKKSIHFEKIMYWGMIICMHAKTLQLCLTLWDCMDCSLQGSSVQGISQARILEWVVISFSRGSSQPRDWTCVSCVAGDFFTAEPPGEPQ